MFEVFYNYNGNDIMHQYNDLASLIQDVVLNYGTHSIVSAFYQNVDEWIEIKVRIGEDQ
jgi:hypothetical protein